MPDQSDFNVDRISNADYPDTGEDKSLFAVDSGYVIFVNEDILIEFLSNFDFGDLVDSPVDLINVGYWNLLFKREISDVALICSTGVDSGGPLDGDGAYKVS